MERQLFQRMLGAAVLVLGLVLLGPLVFDGRRPGPRTATEGTTIAVGSDELQTRTVRLDARAIGESSRQSSAAAMPPVAPAPPPANLPRPAAVPTDLARAAPNLPAPQPLPESTQPLSASRSQPAAVPGPPTASIAPSDSPPRPAQTQPAAGSGWVVQLGSFGQRDNAERLTRDLKALGFAAFVSPLSQSGKTLYRVRVGPEGERGAAEDLAKRLASAGHAGPVVPQ